jgi:kynurenine formamidase
VTAESAPGWVPGKGWGWIWGPQDEIGALNSMSAASTRAALSRVREGRTIDLGVAIDRNSYLAPPHVRTEVVSFRTPDGLVREGGPGYEDRDGVSFNTSMIIVSDHAGTQLDGLCHATSGPDRHWYNGFNAADHGGDFGPMRAGAHNIPPILAPGVLIDIPASKGLDELPTGYPISVADLADALDAQQVELAVGDVVLIRTGAMRHWGAAGHDHDRIHGPDSAGLTLAAARWLVDTHGALLIGADNSTVEVTPAVDGAGTAPVHQYLLVEQGVHMGELHFLEQLSTELIYEFCYLALAPKLRHTTAGFAMRPIALV